MKKSVKKAIHQAEFFVSIALVLTLTLYLLGNPNITGFLSLDFVMQDLDMTLTQSQNYIISSDSTEPFILTSFKLSGEVIGDGIVEIYLDNNLGQQLLIYRNVKSKGGMSMITGMVVAGEKNTAEGKAEKETYLMLDPGYAIENTKINGISDDEKIVEGVFSNECTDTCFMKMELSENASYNLLFKIEPGTVLKLDNIIYTIEID